MSNQVDPYDLVARAQIANASVAALVDMLTKELAHRATRIAELESENAFLKGNLLKAPSPVGTA